MNDFVDAAACAVSAAREAGDAGAYGEAYLVSGAIWAGWLLGQALALSNDPKRSLRRPDQHIRETFDYVVRLRTDPRIAPARDRVFLETHGADALQAWSEVWHVYDLVAERARE